MFGSKSPSVGEQSWPGVDRMPWSVSHPCACPNTALLEVQEHPWKSLQALEIFKLRHELEE